MPTPTIVPFWNRLPAFALYPLQGSALASLIVFAVLMALASLVPFVGWLLVLLLWLGAYRQAFEMLLATANGRLQAPDVDLSIGDGTVLRYVLLLILVIAVPLIVAVVAGPIPALLAFVMFGVLLPAATIGLAISGSVRVALNPEYLWRIASRIGWPYLAVIGLSLVMQYSAGNASTLLSHVLPSALAGIVGTVFSLWAMFATFHLMGYLVWQYHETLDYVPAEPLTPGELPKTRDAELLERVEGLIASGEVDVALVHLRETIRDRAVDLPVHELYRRALKLKGDRKAVLDHAKLMLQALIVAKQDRKALALVRDSLQLDPTFAPFELEDAERLANVALHGGQTDLALAMFKGLIDAHPRHARLPHWALQASDLTLRRGEDPGRAKKWLSDAEALTADDELRRRLGAQRAALGL